MTVNNRATELALKAVASCAQAAVDQVVGRLGASNMSEFEVVFKYRGTWPLNQHQHRSRIMNTLTTLFSAVCYQSRLCSSCASLIIYTWPHCRSWLSAAH